MAYSNSVSIGDSRQELLQRGLLTLSALDYLDQGISVFDHDLKLVTWNNRMAELLELPERLFQVGVPFEAFIRFNADRGEYGPGDVETMVARRIALARAFEPHCIERTRPNGTILEIRGNPLSDGGGFVTVYTDVTLRRRSEQQLKESYDLLEQRVLDRTRELRSINRRLREEIRAHKETANALKENDIWIRSIADAVPALIAYVDADLRYQFLNKKHEEWFGLSPTRLIGKSFTDVPEPRNQNRIREDVHSVLHGETVHREYDVKNPGGDMLNLKISYIPHVAESGDIAGFFFLGQDLTEYKQAQTALVEAQNMQAVGQLTGGIAHDFNNLLTIIMGNLTFLEDEFADREDIMEIIESSMKAAQRGSDLISRLLAFSRRQPLHTSEVDINQLVSETSRLLQRTLGETIRVVARLNPQLWHAVLDHTQMENALVNLSINARDAMPSGGRLTLRTDNYVHKSSGKSAAGRLKPGSYVLIEVSDNGMGMSTDTLARAFEPFFTTKDSKTGSGLGLSMVYGFVKQSGGVVDLSSTVGKGTRVRMYLPAMVTDAPNQAHSIDQPPGDEAGGNETVLLVEDDPDVRRYVHRALTELHYAVYQAQDGVTALDMLADKPFDLLLTDVVMPGEVSGFDLVDHVRQRALSTRVLCMSGYPPEMTHPGTAGKNYPLIHKPFQKSELARAIRQVLDD